MLHLKCEGSESDGTDRNYSPIKINQPPTICLSNIESLQVDAMVSRGGCGNSCFNTFSANPTKWSNTLKRIVGKSRRIILTCLTVLWG